MTDRRDHTLQGQNFWVPYLVGAGTLTEDGQYAPPEPDPTVRRGVPRGVKVPEPDGEQAPGPTRSRKRRTRAEIDASQPDLSRVNDD